MSARAMRFAILAIALSVEPVSAWSQSRVDTANKNRPATKNVAPPTKQAAPAPVTQAPAKTTSPVTQQAKTVAPPPAAQTKTATPPAAQQKTTTAPANQPKTTTAPVTQQQKTATQQKTVTSPAPQQNAPVTTQQKTAAPVNPPKTAAPVTTQQKTATPPATQQKTATPPVNPPKTAAPQSAQQKAAQNKTNPAPQQTKAAPPQTKAAPPQTKAPAGAAAGQPGAGRGANAQVPAPRDTVIPTALMREVYDYSREGRRDPFISLLTTSDLRPTLSDLRLLMTVVDEPGRSVALVANGFDKKNPQKTLRVGDRLGRMRVSSIRSDAVIFTIEEFGMNRRDSLLLRDPSKTGVGR
jgi:hypothetical protein